MRSIGSSLFKPQTGLFAPEPRRELIGGNPSEPRPNEARLPEPPRPDPALDRPGLLRPRPRGDLRRHASPGPQAGQRGTRPQASLHMRCPPAAGG